ncbi:hypothetical protein ABIF99_009503 [Bradyrhizobium japonicum]
MNGLAVQRKANGRAFAGRGEIGRAHGKAVNVGTVERRNVDRRRDVFGERRAERIGNLARLARDRAREQRSFKARQRVLAREDLEELLLFERAAVLRLRDHRHAKPISLPHQIGIDRRPCRKSLVAGGNEQPCIGPGNGLKRPFPHRKREPRMMFLGQQGDFGDADTG